MDCTLCYDSFNQLDRQPMILSCGHSFCKQCILRIEKKYGNQIECPFKCSFGSGYQIRAKPNITVLELIKKKKLGTEFYGLCPKHPINVQRLICRTCRVELCEECVSGHSGHEFEKLKYSEAKLNDIFSEANREIGEGVKALSVAKSI